jgi:hypothetical protein
MGTKFSSSFSTKRGDGISSNNNTDPIGINNNNEISTISKPLPAVEIRRVIGEGIPASGVSLRYFYGISKYKYVF